MDVAEEISMSGLDIGQFALDFTWYFRNLLLLRVSKSAAGRIEISSDKLAELKEVAKIGEENDLYRYIRIFSKLSADIKYSTSKRAELEIALIKLCRPEMEEDRESLIARINKLETIIENGDFINNTTETEKTVQKFINDCEKKFGKLDSITLSSTHLPWLSSYFKKVIPKAKLYDPADNLVKAIKPYTNISKGKIYSIISESEKYPVKDFLKILNTLNIKLDYEII